VMGCRTVWQVNGFNFTFFFIGVLGRESILFLPICLSFGQHYSRVGFLARGTLVSERRIHLEF